MNRPILMRMIKPNEGRDVALNSRARDRILAVGVGLELAAMVDIFVVRRAQRPVGGTLITTGCALLMTYFLLRAFAQATYSQISRLPFVLSIIAAGSCGGIALIELVFTVFRAGSSSTRSFFVGAVVVVLGASVLLVLLADSLLERRSRATRP